MNLEENLAIQPAQNVAPTGIQLDIPLPSSKFDGANSPLQAELWPKWLKGALYRIWCGVNRLGDSGVKVV